MLNNLFPFKSITKGSKVVLYGAGKIGSIFWKQNELVKWCDICLVVDSNYPNIKDFPVKVESPKEICKLKEIDYIIIAILSDKSRYEIRQRLEEEGIPNNKIIEKFDYYYDGTNFENIIYKKNEVDEQNNVLNVALEYMDGGIGDYVVFLKFYQELVGLAPKSVIDIYNFFTFITKEMVESIMYSQRNLRYIKKIQMSKGEYEQYDIVIHLDFELTLLKLNLSKVERISPLLAKKMQLLYIHQKKDFVDSAVYSYATRIFVDRANFHGWNRHTALRAGNAFEISDQYAELNINPEYAVEFERLKLNKPYITFNYGANKNVRKIQTKVWPYEYHVELNNMLKKRFPDIEIIQIGEECSEYIPGANRYIFGKQLDIVKQILKNAICHFDCEGGLVHIATQLGTKCFVVFGPTPVWYFGYDKNENIIPECCGECMGVIKDWQTRCYLYDKPKCMHSILPQHVFLLLEKYLVRRCYDF